jgi:hypothetical protein
LKIIGNHLEYRQSHESSAVTIQQLYTTLEYTSKVSGFEEIFLKDETRELIYMRDIYGATTRRANAVHFAGSLILFAYRLMTQYRDRFQAEHIYIETAVFFDFALEDWARCWSLMGLLRKKAKNFFLRDIPKVKPKPIIWCDTYADDDGEEGTLPSRLPKDKLELASVIWFASDLYPEQNPTSSQSADSTAETSPLTDGECASLIEFIEDELFKILPIPIGMSIEELLKVATHNRIKFLSEHSGPLRGYDWCILSVSQVDFSTPAFRNKHNSRRAYLLQQLHTSKRALGAPEHSDDPDVDCRSKMDTTVLRQIKLLTISHSLFDITDSSAQRKRAKENAKLFRETLEKTGQLIYLPVKHGSKLQIAIDHECSRFDGRLRDSDVTRKDGISKDLELMRESDLNRGVMWFLMTSTADYTDLPSIQSRFFALIYLLGDSPKMTQMLHRLFEITRLPQFNEDKTARNEGRSPRQLPKERVLLCFSEPLAIWWVL